MKSRLRPLCVFVLSLVFTQWGRRGLFRAEVWHQDQPGVQRMRSKGILTVDDFIELIADELDLRQR